MSFAVLAMRYSASASVPMVFELDPNHKWGIVGREGGTGGDAVSTVEIADISR
jgi:hypothetical protein